MRGLRIPAPIADFTGSFILEWQAGLSNYQGTWTSGPDTYACTFTYDPITALAYATANVDLAGTLDFGLFPQQKIPLPPKLVFVAASTTAFLLPWSAALTITG